MAFGACASFVPESQEAFKEGKRFPLAFCQRDHNWQLHEWQWNVRCSPFGLPEMALNLANRLEIVAESVKDFVGVLETLDEFRYRSRC